MSFDFSFCQVSLEVSVLGTTGLGNLVATVLETDDYDDDRFPLYSTVDREISVTVQYLRVDG